MADTNSIRFWDKSGLEAFSSDFADINSGRATTSTIAKAALITIGAPFVFTGVAVSSTAATTAVGFGAIVGSINGALSAGTSGGSTVEIITASAIGLSIGAASGLITFNPIAAGFLGGSVGQAAGDVLTTQPVDVDKAFTAGIFGAIGGGASSIFAGLGLPVRAQITVGALFEILGSPIISRAENSVLPGELCPQ